MFASSLEGVKYSTLIIQVNVGVNMDASVQTDKTINLKRKIKVDFKDSPVRRYELKMHVSNS